MNQIKVSIRISNILQYLAKGHHLFYDDYKIVMKDGGLFIEAQFISEHTTKVKHLYLPMTFEELYVWAETISFEDYFMRGVHEYEHDRKN